MSRIAILAAAALLGSTGLTLAQQPASHSQRHPALSGSSMERSAHPAKTAADQFTSEAEAKSRCRGDTVVWVNTKTHIYHFSGSSAFGHTKHGAFMCQADADRSGKLRAAKNETASPAPASGSTAPRR